MHVRLLHVSLHAYLSYKYYLKIHLTKSCPYQFIHRQMLSNPSCNIQQQFSFHPKSNSSSDNDIKEQRSRYLPWGAAYTCKSCFCLNRGCSKETVAQESKLRPKMRKGKEFSLLNSHRALEEPPPYDPSYSSHGRHRSVIIYKKVTLPFYWSTCISFSLQIYKIHVSIYVIHLTKQHI